jgi:TolA-binding protein
MADEAKAKALLQEAMSQEKSGCHDRAVQLFIRLTSEYPDSDLADNAYYNLGICYKTRGDLEKAFVAFKTVVKDYPKSDACIWAKDQIEDLENQQDPASDHYLEAESAMIRGDLVGAWNGFSQIMKEFPSSSLADNALFNLGSIAKTRGDFERSVQILDRVLKDYPDSDAAANIREMREE